MLLNSWVFTAHSVSTEDPLTFATLCDQVAFSYCIIPDNCQEEEGEGEEILGCVVHKDTLHGGGVKISVYCSGYSSCYALFCLWLIHLIIIITIIIIIIIIIIILVTQQQHRYRSAAAALSSSSFLLVLSCACFIVVVVGCWRQWENGEGGRKRREQRTGHPNSGLSISLHHVFVKARKRVSRDRRYTLHAAQACH